MDDEEVKKLMGKTAGYVSKSMQEALAHVAVKGTAYLKFERTEVGLKITALDPDTVREEPSV